MSFIMKLVASIQVDELSCDAAFSNDLFKTLISRRNITRHSQVWHRLAPRPTHSLRARYVALTRAQVAEGASSSVGMPAREIANYA
jgi:hypothetical protein